MVDEVAAATMGFMSTVVTRGEASLEAIPDRASLLLVMSASAGMKHKALEIVNAGVGVLKECLARVDVKVKDERLWTNQWTDARRVTFFAVNQRFTVDSSNPEALDEVIRCAVNIKGCEISGPQWFFSDSHPIHQQVREKAIKQALARARDYASALGGSIVDVLEIRDEGVENAFNFMAGAESHYRGSAAASSESINFDTSPRPQDVSGTVCIVCRAEGLAVEVG